MSKILIITGQFAPYTQSLGGILRVFSFLKTLEKKHKIFLVASKSFKNKKYGYLGLLKKDLKNFNINYIKNNNSRLILSLFNFRIFRNLFYLLGFDYTLNIKDDYYEKCTKIIEKNNIDYIIISSPPFSLFHLAKRFKSRYKNIKIILDYRDGWSTRINVFFTYPLKYLVQKFIEKKILNYTDYTLSATSRIHSKIRSLSENNNKNLLVRNGFLIKPAIKRKINNKIRIGYFGLISEDSSSYRNIRVVYDVMKKNKFLQKKIIFEFYGNNNIKDINIKNFCSFKFKDNLNYKQALSKMTEMNYLLILHTEKSTAKEMVTSKFYDYLSSRTQIINICNGKNEVGAIIKGLKLGYNINYENKNLEEFLIKLKRINRKIKWKKNFNIFSRDFQNKQLSKIIN